MQKPVLLKALAFVFSTVYFFSCETYDPNANRNQSQSQKKPAVVHPAKPSQEPVKTNEINNGGIIDPGHPSTKPNEQIVKHFAYTLSYNEEHELASWIYYTLKGSYTLGKEKRTDDFREDPAVRTQSAEPEDYKLSGYDRGHLVPAGDMKWNKKAMSESFLMSNIAPQTHAFNAGIWETLESQVRSWAKIDSQIYIVTGPVLQGNLKIIGENKVTVPEYFYKAILDVTEPELKCIAFIIPNKGSKQPVLDFAVTVDSLEALTQTDFFPGLPDDLETRLESSIDKKLWKAQQPVKRKKRSR